MTSHNDQKTDYNSVEMKHISQVTLPLKHEWEDTLSETTGSYRLSWRTAGAFVALSLSWAVTTFAIVGPNSSIGNIIADFPGEESKATWIANAGLFCLVTLPTFNGTFSDRYGKKWFIMGGALFGMVGAIVSGTAKNVETVIGGQAMGGVGGTMTIVGVAASMEIVPAKYRGAMIAAMATVNASAGVITGTLAFAACIQNGFGWRWGFYILAIFYGVVFAAVGVLYNPPATRLRRAQPFKELLKSVDYFGIILLALGGALLTIPLVWGGSLYAWNSAHVIPFLIIGSLLLITFGIYEWKGRADGILHHEFFNSISFPILLVYGFVDGMLLYGTSLYIPNQMRQMYTTEPFGVAIGYLCFNGPIIAGHFFWGFVMTKTNNIRISLLVASLGLTLFCGLATLANPRNLALFEGMLAAIGFLTSATQVIPTAGVGLVVPHHLIATGNTVLGTARALGGALGIAIFTTVYNAKTAISIPAAVIPVLNKVGIPPQMAPTIIRVVTNAPQALAQVPGLTPGLIDEIIYASRAGASMGFRNVWFCFMAASAMCFILSFFLTDVKHRMTNHVESELEPTRTVTKDVAPV